MNDFFKLLDPHSPITATVLVIDDAPAMLRLIAEGFKEDYKLLTAQSGEQGLELCAQLKPDLVLLDVDMPEMDGYEVCRRIKSNPVIAHIPVIFVTGHEDPSFEAQAFDVGAADFLVKPLHFQTAKARINSQIRLNRAMGELQNFNEVLEDRVAQRTLDLEKALADLGSAQADLLRWQAKATLTTLVASVSHDLGTPIGNALMASTTVQIRLGRCKTIVAAAGYDNPDLLSQMDVAIRNSQLIENNLERAGNLLSNFHRVASDQVSELRRTFDLAMVVRETINSLSPSLRKYPHHLEVDIAPDVKMDSYPGALSRVLINLINNSYIHAFTDQREGRLVIKGKRWGEYVDLEIRDNGVGMEPEVLKRIFDPFYTTRGSADGTGLGLAIAKGQVDEVLKGTMTVVSGVGLGTKFRLVLPIKVGDGQQPRLAPA